MKFTIQYLVSAVLQRVVEADELEDALEEGKKAKWEDLIAKKVDVLDGSFHVQGIFADEW